MKNNSDKTPMTESCLASVMQSVIVEFQTAKLAKEKRFIGYKSKVHYRISEKCLINGLIEDYADHNLTENYLSAPPQSILKNWLKEVHNIIIEIGLDQTSYPKYCFNIYKYEDFGNWEDVKNPDWGLYSSEEKCLEEALFLALQNVSETVA
jgi:hypothetical protein